MIVGIFNDHEGRRWREWQPRPVAEAAKEAVPAKGLKQFCQAKAPLISSLGQECAEPVYTMSGSSLKKA
jgi:hypothetical protein